MLVRSLTILATTQHVALHECSPESPEGGQVSRFQKYPAMVGEFRYEEM